MERKLSSFAEADQQWKIEQDAVKQQARHEHSDKTRWKFLNDKVKRVDFPHPLTRRPPFIFFSQFAAALCAAAVHLKSQSELWDKLQAVMEWCNPEGVEALQILELASEGKKQDVAEELSQYHPW